MRPFTKTFKFLKSSFTKKNTTIFKMEGDADLATSPPLEDNKKRQMKPLATLRPDWRNLFKDVPNKVEMIETIFEQTAYKTAEVFRQQVRSLHYNSLYVAIATGDARYRLTQEEIASMYETVNFDQVHHQLTAIYAENRDEKRSCGRPLAI